FKKRSVVLFTGHVSQTWRTQIMSPTDNVTPVLAPDFAAVKTRQQSTWASGDFSVVASRIVFQAEHLCEIADLQAGWHVLDVATGSGNAPIAAARRGREAAALHHGPPLPHRGRPPPAHRH